MKLARQSDDAILAVANPIMDNLMQASTDVDHAAHVRDFTDRLKAIVTEKRLQEICARYQPEWGHFVDREPAAIFRRPDSVVIVWRQTCTRAAGEFVAEMVLVQEEDRYLVDHVTVF